MKTMETTEEVSSLGWKSVWKGAIRSDAPLCQRKTVGSLGKGLASLWSREENQKNAPR